MILNDKEIYELALDHDMIYPYFSEKVGDGKISFGQSSAGYDIRLGEDLFLIKKQHQDDIVDPKDFDNELLVRLDSFTKYDRITKDPEPPEYIASSVFYLPPHSYALGVSAEKFTMPYDVMGICVGKSTYARAGLIVNTTPIEPGWVGYLTIELSNPTENTIVIYQGEGICQVVFFRTQNAVAIPYGNGKYQFQGVLPVPPRM